MEPENRIIASRGHGQGMIGATDDRDGAGRSLRSSRRAGKPSTGRRGTVGTASRQEEDDPSISVNTEAILDMQRKLYRWSHAEPNKVFHDLFNLVCDRRTLALAWQWLCRNSGSRTPGTDGLNRRKIEERPGGASQYLEEVREELRSGTYRPQPVRQRLIPKPNKPGQFRPLGIPTIKDRLVQMALKIVLEPIFEADFFPTSYGFRRGRSTHDALAMIQRQLHPNHAGPSRVRYVIEGDIKGCFDNIDHHLLMDRVRRRIGDRKVLHLVLAFLKAGIMVEGSVRTPVVGTPQGGIISPLLANIHLSAIDERYSYWTPAPRETTKRTCQRRNIAQKRGRPTFFLVRYADDFVILVSGTEEQAIQEKEELAEFLRRELRMELSMEKTLVTDAEKGFDFLGYRVVKKRALRTGQLVGNLYIPKRKVQMLRDRIKAEIRRYPTGHLLGKLAWKLNPVITGWRSYYQYATGASRVFADLDWWLQERLFRWLRKKHRKATWQQLLRHYVVPSPKVKRPGKGGFEALRRFQDGGTHRYECRGIRIPNGWNADQNPSSRHGAEGFWKSHNTLRSL